MSLLSYLILLPSLVIFRRQLSWLCSTAGAKMNILKFEITIPKTVN